jgi:hypothetical protein
MILLTDDGQRIEWDFELDPDMADDLTRWRDFVEARLSLPLGSVAGFQWDEAGALQIVVRRGKLLGV